MPVQKEVNKKFFTTWSAHMAYVLGFFFADGTITVNKNGSAYFVIQIADEMLLKNIRSAMNSEHKITRRVHKKDASVFYRLQIGHRELIKDLYELGVKSNKAQRMRMPDVPSQYFGDFVRGYFDGDGNVWTGLTHKNRAQPLVTIQTGFTSCSGDFLNDLRHRLEKYGILGSCYPRKGLNVFRLQYSIKSSILLYDLMYKSVTKDLFLNRKKKVFERFMEEKNLRS